MQELFIKLTTLLTTSPGNLVLHLCLAIAVMAALQIVLLSRREDSPVPPGRMVFGLGMLLLGQIVLFLGSGAAWQKIADPQILLPPLDRAVSTWSLLWIVWLWCFPRPARTADVVHLVANLGLVIAFLFSLSAWSAASPGRTFNGTLLDWGWGILAIVFALTGILILLLTRPQGWGVGFSILLLNLIGYVVYLVWGDISGSFASQVRLAQICSYPLLPALAGRLSPINLFPLTASETMPQEKRRYTADPRSVYAWLQLATQKDPQKTYQALTRAIAHSMLADLCYLVHTPTQDGNLVIECGYDQVRDEILPGLVLPQSKIPTIASSIQRGRSFRQGGNGQVVPELAALAGAFGLERPGNLLLIPLTTPKTIWGGLILLSPYSERVWSPSDQTYLLTTTDTIVHILEQATEPSGAETTREAMQTEIDSLRARLAERPSQLQPAVPAAQAALAQSPELEPLLNLQKESQQIIAKLQAENDQLRSDVEQQVRTLDKTNPETAHYEQELHLALEEMAHLQNALAGANMKILSLEMQAKHAGTSANDGREVYGSMLQELRQPLTSIIGYTELLMSESVGILGALQRKLLDRIRISTQRMSNLLKDMSRVVNANGDSFDQSALRPVDIHEVMDRAVAEVAPYMQDKEIALSTNLSESLPTLNGDQDAIEQIVIQLLENATTVTPQQGHIDFRLSQEDTGEQPYILLQITDNGGGIATEDLPRVFWRQYRHENPVIAGLGDTGVGLTVARTLVEAQGGRIWVDSLPGQTTTFSVLLPINNTHLQEVSDLDERPA